MPKITTPRQAKKKIGPAISEEAFEALLEVRNLKGGSPTSTAEMHLELFKRIKPALYDAAVAAFLKAGQN